MNDAEKLREDILDIERSRNRERELRHQLEGLLDGFRRLTLAWDTNEIFETLIEILHPLLEFQDAVILQCVESSSIFRPIAGRSSLFNETQWIPGKLFQRVQNGNSVAIFDINVIDEWQQQSPHLRANIFSALHIPLKGPRPAMLICTHSRQGAFTRQHLRLAEQISPLASQALLAIENHELRLQHMQIEQEEAAARERAALLKQATQLLGMGVALLDENGTLVDASETLTMMLATWKSPNHWWQQATQTFQFPSIGMCPNCAKAAYSGKVFVDLNAPNGKRTVLEVTFAGHAHHVGQTTEGHMLIIADITRWICAEEALKRLNEEIITTRDEALQANKAKSVFLANMSHELRTPLNAIIGYSELLTESFLEANTQTDDIEDLKRITAASNHLVSVINNILDLSKIEADRMDVFLESVFIEDVISALQSTVIPQMAANNNQFVVKLDSNLSMVYADEMKLRQTLINLVSNAAKFTEHGNIELCVTRKDNHWILFKVSDNGIGMSPEVLKNVFEPFTQADTSSTRKYGGTGLGLSISRHFAKLMGGTLSASSYLGEGSTFTLMLPIYQTKNHS